MADAISRRHLLAWASSGLGAALWSSSLSAQTFPRLGEFVRFADPLTETPVVRLTSPAYRNVLPPAHNHYFAAKSHLLFCSSDRIEGRLQPSQIDLKTGIVRSIATAHDLDTTSLAADVSGKSLFFLDGQVLTEVVVNSRRERRQGNALAQKVTAFGLGSTRAELFFVAEGKLQQLKRDASPVLAEAARGPCLVRPGGHGCLFSRIGEGTDTEYWYAASDPQVKPVKLASGAISNPYWSLDGSSLIFLRDVPQNQVTVATICAVDMESKAERRAAKTSQFVSFAPNGNDSVFVGASGSKAQPAIVLLLRLTGRELTLCEHRASRAVDAQPAFSPDSRRIFFESDREGKSAIYGVNVEHLVEPTGEPTNESSSARDS